MTQPPRVLVRLLVAVFFFSAFAGAADVPQIINFQGRLTDNGNNPESGNIAFTFRFYDALSGGNQLPMAAPWSENQTLTVTNGVFSAQIGSVTPIPYSVFQTTSVYMQITVDGEILSPRETLVTSPFAFNASALSGLTYDAFVDTTTTQSINGFKTFNNQLTISSNVIINAEGGTILVPRKSTIGDPAGGVDGMIYYNENSNKFRGFQNNVWNDMVTNAAVDIIANQAFLQPGATFYVSSGSVQGNLNVYGDINVKGLNYNWPAAHGNGVLTDNGSGTLSWAPAGAGQFILNTDILQPGSTFFTSSGTVNGQFIAMGNVGIGTATPAALLDINGDGSTILIPRKTTALDPLGGADGMIYYNANSGKFRAHQGGGWGDMITDAATDVIQNTSILQAGATFYVSSGSVQGNLYVYGTMNGNGSGITNLAASQLTGTVSSTVLPSTVAYTNANQLWTAPQTFGSSITVNNAALLGAAGQAVTVSSNLVMSGALVANNSAGTAGQILQSQGPGATPTWIASPASSLLTTTNTWSAAQTFTSSITVSTHIVVNNGGIISGNGSGLTNLQASALVGNNLPGGSTSYVQIGNSLQAGATFFVSSGTVNNLTVGTSIGLPNNAVALAALANGTLPSGVVASSIAASSVYPEALQSTVYPNITGVGAQSQALNMNTHQINGVLAPTLATDAVNKQYVDSLSASNTNYIHNTSALQAGSTFYVSSGTVNSFTVVTSLALPNASVTDAALASTPNSASSLNTLVKRDGAGNFAANTVTANLNGNASTATGATNLNGGSAGAMPFQSGVNNTIFLSSGVTGQFLKQGGSSAPYWATISSGDVSNVIALQSTLQSGATFFVSSGTVAGNFSAGTNGFHVVGSSVGIGTTAPGALLDISGDGSTVLFPRKSDALDPLVGADGMIYYNASTAKFRAHQGGGWGDMITNAATDVIQNTSILQAGATFYVSSGTVAGPLTVGGNLVVSNGAGTNGYILQSQGPGLAPTWITSPASSLLTTTNTWTAAQTFKSSVTVSTSLVVGGELVVNNGAGTNGYILQSQGPGLAPTWITSPASSLLTTTNTWTAAQTFTSSVTVSTSLVVGGELVANNGAGSNGYILQSQGPGLAPTWITSPASSLLTTTNTWTAAQTFKSSVTISTSLVVGGELVANNGAGTNGYILQSQGPGLAPTWITSPASSLLSTTNTWTAANTYVSSSTFSGAVLISTTVMLQGSTGSSGQVFTSGGPGAAATWSTLTGAALASTQTWTGGNTFLSSTTFNGAVVVSTSIILQGSQGTNGQVLTSGGPGAVATWSTLTGAALASTQTWTGGNTYLSSSTFNGTVLVSTHLTVNNGGIISGDGSGITNLAASQLTGIVPSSVLPSTVAYTSLAQLWSQPQTFASSITVNNAALLGAANQAVTISSNLVMSGALVANNSAGTAGQILQSQGPGATPTWIASPAASLLTTTNTWTAAQTFMSSVTVSTHLVVNNGGIISGNGSGITSLTASQLTGTVPSGVLPSTVAYTSVAQLWSQPQNFNDGLGRRALGMVGNSYFPQVAIATTTTSLDAALLVVADSVGNSVVADTYGSYIQNAAINTVFNAKNKYGSYIVSNGAFTGGGGASNTNYGLYVGDVSGGDVNYSAIFSAGNVGIGNATPAQPLDVTGNVQFSGALMPGGAAGSSGQILQSNGAGAAPTWIASPAASLLATTNTWTAGNTYLSSSSFSGAVLISTTVMLQGSTGSSGQVFTSGGPGAAATWSTLTGAALASTQTWTGGNTFLSSTTFNGAVVVSTSIILQGSAGADGQVLTSGGPGAVATWSTLTGAALASTQTWTGGNTYLSSSTFNGTVLVSTHLTVNNGGIISGNGSGITNLAASQLTGTVASTVLPSTVAYTSVAQLWTAPQIHSSSVTITSPMGLGVTYGAVLGSATINNLTNNQFVKTDGSNHLVSGTLTPTDIPGGATSYIQLTSALQSGATFFVSSGTVAGTLTAGTFAGSGASLTSLPASQLTGTVSSTVLPSTVAYTSANQLWTAPQTFSSSITVNNAVLLGAAGQAVTVSSNLVMSGALVANNSAGTAGQILQSQGPGATPTWIASPAASLLTTTNTWTAAQTFTSSVTVSTSLVVGGELVANNGAGTNGYILQSQGPGLAPTWITSPAASLLTSTNTWTAGNTYLSSSTFNGVVLISTTVVLQGSTGSSGQVFTSGGPGAAATWSTLTGAALASTQTWTGGNTFLSSTTFNGTVLVSTHLTVNNGGIISGNGSGLTNLQAAALTGNNLPGGSTSYIQNTSALQSGSTFYVSSGTVAGQFTVGGAVNIAGSPINSTNSNLNVRGFTGDGPAITVYNGDDTAQHTQLWSNSAGFRLQPFQDGVSYMPVAMDGSNFVINAGTSTHAEVMRIDISRNVGIGTASPATKLHMSSGILTLDGAGSGITMVAGSSLTLNGTLMANGSAGTVTQVLQSNGPGAAPTWVNNTAGVSLHSTNTWTAGNTYLSSSSFSGAVLISTTVVLQGSTGSSGQVFTSGGPGAAATWSTLTGAALASTQTWTGGNTYLSSTTFNGTVLVSTHLIVNSGRVDLTNTNAEDSYSLRVGSSTSAYNLVVSTTGNVGIGTSAPGYRLHVAGGSIGVDVVQGLYNVGGSWTNSITPYDSGGGLNLTFNSATGLYVKDNGGNNRLIVTSLGTTLGASGEYTNVGGNLGVTGNVGLGTSSPATKLHVSSGIITLDGAGSGITMVAGSSLTLNGTLMANGSAGTATQVLQSNGPGAAPTWVNNTAGVSLHSTNTWTAGNTYVSSSTFSGAVLISTTVVLQGSTGSSGQVFTSGGPGAAATWSTLTGAALASTQTWTGGNTYLSSSTFNGTVTFSSSVVVNNASIAITDGQMGSTIKQNASTFDIDWNTGNTQHVILDGANTLTFANGVSGRKYVLVVKQDGSGGHTVTWPATVRFPGGVAPVLTSAANKTDYFAFMYNDVDSKYDNLGETLNY